MSLRLRRCCACSLAIMHPRARLNWDCIIGKAPPFLLWLTTSGDIDLLLAKVSLGGGACKMVRGPIAQIAIETRKRQDQDFI